MLSPLCMLMALLALLILAGCAANPEPIDSDPDSGFAIYRSGRLSRQDLARLCRQGVEEILVLDGDASQRECRWRRTECPHMKVRYNRAQDARQPVSVAFLEAFSEWVDGAREAGRKVAFRCRHGWHRTGRLAAFYRIREQGWSSEVAAAEMLRVGRFMSRFPELEPQVESMADLLAGQACSQEERYCPQTEESASAGLDPSQSRPQFLADACEEREDLEGAP